MLRIRLFGTLTASFGEQPLDLPARAQTRRLLAWLLLHPARQQSRAHLAFVLWPDETEPEAKAILRRSLHLLRRYLADYPDAGRIEAGRNDLRWQPGEALWLDHADFELALDAAALDRPLSASSARTESARRALDAAVSLYAEDLLVDWTEAWVIPERERLRQRFHLALERQSDLAAEAGDLSTALAAARRLLATDRLSEPTHRRLMRLLERRGDRAGALRQFDRCRRLLASELGVDPDAETMALFQDILGRDEAPGAEPAAVPQASVWPLARPSGEGPEGPHPRSAQAFGAAPPSALTALVGRAEARDRLLEALETARLITLLGPGGVGKTRLAIALADALAQAGRRAPLWMALASLEPEADLAAALAAALGLDLASGQPPLAALVEHLRHRPALLILDNCEHVLAPAARLTRALLSASPELRVLTTSRAALGIPGERVQRLDPLPLPPVGSDLAAQSPEHRSDALRLFLARARAAEPDFALSAENADAVRDIVRALDGLPLALELAAAQLRWMSPAELASSLASGGDRRGLDVAPVDPSAPDRHRSLEDCIAWSWQALPEAARALAAGLSIFQSPASLDDLAQVCAEDSAGLATGLARAQVRPMLARLVEHSLVIKTEREGQARYHMLETIRDYASSRLSERGERPRVARRHLEHCLRLAEAGRPALHGPGEKAWLDGMSRAQADLRAALASALSTAGMAPDEDGRARRDAWRLAAALQPWWLRRGRLAEGRKALRRVEALGDAGIPLELAVALRRGAAELAMAQGDYPAAARLLERALPDAQELEDDRSVAGILAGRAQLADYRGDYRRGEAGWREAQRVYTEIDDAWGQARCWQALAGHAWQQRDFEAARRRYRRALAAYRERGDRAGQAWAWHGLGVVASHAGEPAEARRCYAQCLALGRALDDARILASALAALASAEDALGQAEPARERYAESLALARELGDRRAMAYAIHNLGGLALRAGELDAAEDFLIQALLLRRGLRDDWGAAGALQSIGLLVLQGGQPELAACLFAAGSAWVERAGIRAAPAAEKGQSEIMTRLREQLSEAALARALSRGADMGLEAATALALASLGGAADVPAQEV